MRKTIAVAAATGALLFGGAGVAHATTSTLPAPSSTTTVAQEQQEQQESDKTGLWGLLGLLGLAGLAGLKRRDDVHRGTGTGTTGGGNLRA